MGVEKLEFEGVAGPARAFPGRQFERHQRSENEVRKCFDFCKTALG